MSNHKFESNGGRPLCDFFYVARVEDSAEMVYRHRPPSNSVRGSLVPESIRKICAAGKKQKFKILLFIIILRINSKLFILGMLRQTPVLTHAILSWVTTVQRKPGKQFFLELIEYSTVQYI